MPKSESESKLSDKSSNMSSSMWGSFSGSFIESGSVGDKSEVVTQGPRSQEMMSPVNVAPGHSSVLGGDTDQNQDIEATLAAWTEADQQKFASSRLVVTDANVVSPDSPSVEIISHDHLTDVVKKVDEDKDDDSPASNNPDSLMLASVELNSPQSVSSIEIISPESEQAPELSSPSSGSTVEVISPEPDQVLMQESLDSSVSSDKTVIEDQYNESNMQAELEAAMVESEKKSESLSSKSSEIVRVDISDTTSSDIEVLQQNSSRKNSSSHTRNNSDQSSLGVSDDAGDNVEGLRKKNKDLSEVLAARESKLIAVSREIVQLQEESGEMSVRLQSALEQVQKERFKNQELDQRSKVDQEQVMVLKKELMKLQQTLKSKGGDDQEKEEVISDLRSEGEALAKQNGKLSETIRKLRAKEKTHDTEVGKFKTDLEKNVVEVERLRKSLIAKNEVEGTQSETIKSLTEANKAWEMESKKLKNDLEDNVEKVLGLRSSLEGAYREMAEMKRKLEDAAGEAAAAALSKEVSLREEAVGKLDEERRGWNREKQRLELQIVNLQDSIQMTEAGSREREEKLRQEIVIMRVKLEDSDRRQEDMSDCVGQATKPLLRQIETLQSSLREVTSVQERVEQSLGERLHLASQSLALAQERERGLGEKVQEMSAKEVASQEQVNQERSRRIQVETKLEEIQERMRNIEDKRVREKQEIETERKSVSDEIGELKKDKEYLTASLNTEKTESEGRRKKCLALMDQLKERDRRVKELQQEMEHRQSMTGGRSSVTSVSASPTPSQLLDSQWLQGEGVFYSHSSTTGSLYDAAARFGSNAALMESMGAQIKQKEGELVQLQVLLQDHTRLKENMSQELTRLTILADQNESLNEEIAHLKEELTKLQQKYDTMLTMYGEKVEEAEELKLDLQDVKEMYKMQIDQLTHSSSSEK